MAVFTRTTKNLILKIDEFFDSIDLGLLVFREGIRAYLDRDMEALERHIQKVDSLESNADKLQRAIENEMITHSILPQHRAEVVTLIDELDEIIDALDSSDSAVVITRTISEDTVIAAGTTMLQRDPVIDANITIESGGELLIL